MKLTDFVAAFDGWHIPDRFTQVPNQFWDILPELTEAECKVLLVLMRETFGWNRDTCKMSLKKIAAASGVTRRSVQRAMKGTGNREGLENLGLVAIARERDETGDNLVNQYSLPLGTSCPQGRDIESSPLGTQSPHKAVKDSRLDTNEETTKEALRFSFEDKTELIQHLHDLWDDNSTPLQSRLTLLRPWSLQVIQEAAEITTRAKPDEPFAYLYGILKRQPTPPVEYDDEEPLTEEEFEAARAEINRINEEKPWK